MRNYRPSLLATDAAERERFLAALRASGSVAQACAATGIAESTARRQRNRDAAFDMGWTAVTGDPATTRLEAALIARAISGVERTKTWANGTVERTTEFNDDLAFKLLAKRMPDVYGDGTATPAAAPARPRMTRDEFIAAIRARPRTVDLARLDGGGEGATAEIVPTPH